MQSGYVASAVPSGFTPRRPYTNSKSSDVRVGALEIRREPTLHRALEMLSWNALGNDGEALANPFSLCLISPGDRAQQHEPVEPTGVCERETLRDQPAQGEDDEMAMVYLEGVE